MKKLAFLVVLVVTALPCVAAAESTVTVLGLRSATADEEMADRVTDALRQAAESATSSGLTHTGRENHLNQLVLVFDCEEPNEECMQQIGESLNSDRLVYGMVEPQSGRADADYVVALNFFNVETGRVERTLREVVPRSVTEDQLIEIIAQYYGAVTGAVVTGELAIRCNVEGSRVLLGGEEVGTTGAEPLVLRELEPGEVSLVVEHDGYEAYRGSVTIAAGQLREIQVALAETGQGGGGGSVAGSTGPENPPPPPPQRRSLAWLGWTLGGLSLAALGVGIYSGAAVMAAENDIEPDLDNWPQGADICAEAEAGNSPTNTAEDPAQFSGAEVRDMCSTNGTLQILQFVMYGTAAALGAVAIWLLVREYTDEDDEATSRRRLSVAPVVLDGGAAMSATLSF